jgi:hypothetical protein
MIDIAFFTEGNYTGKIPRQHPNMRVDLAWQAALQSDHYPLNTITPKKYDLGIAIIPKKFNGFDLNKFKESCRYTAVMQEGPNWYWQDWDILKQAEYLNILSNVDFVLVHNESDLNYYSGLLNKECFIMQSVLIEDSIGTLHNPIDRNHIMVGGNFCSWYGGMDSYCIGANRNMKLIYPSMGRKVANEERMPDVQHLPYMTWTDWFSELSRAKYGIHLMRTHAAGTFALCCAYLGIPCLGYRGLDTQQILHPDLTVDLGDLKTAREYFDELTTNDEFYMDCSIQARNNYNDYYTEFKFIERFYDSVVSQIE